MSVEKHSEYEFETRALMVGQEPEQWNCRAVTIPIFLSSNYSHTAPGETSGYYYGRSTNPTRDSLQPCLASLEKAKYALVFSSGTGAEVSVIQMLKTGDHILTGYDVYSGTSLYFRKVATKSGIEISFTDFCELETLESKLQSNTRLVWMEVCTNPLLRVADIREISRIVKTKAPGAILVVDNTFMSPYFSNPLEHGADIVMHSVTKYINGHTDVTMGMIATNRQDLYDELHFIQKACGIVSSPMDCFLVNRGIKTLAIRMERHAENAMKISKYLEASPLISMVTYPGLESHKDYQIAKKQLTGFGGMVNFYIRGDIDTMKRFLKNLKLCTLAVSLGGAETLISVPSLMTHTSLSPEARLQLGITDTLARLSVGLEGAEDLIQDLDYALKAAQ